MPVTQQCASAAAKASAAGPVGGKVAQRKPAGTAVPARRLARPQVGRRLGSLWPSLLGIPPVLKLWVLLLDTFFRQLCDE